MAAMPVAALLGVWVLPFLTLAFDPSKWEVTTMPGLSEPVNFKHYSGFLNAADGRQLHYWFMESQRSPTDDPLVLWLTGGPGCSALSAVATELGPFRIGPLGVNVTMNPYSWNKRILRSPQGLNVKGYGIGNGAVDFKLHFKATIFYANYHSLLGRDLWDEITSNCCNNSISEETCDFTMNPKRIACSVPVSKVYNLVFESGLNFQNLYDPCNLAEAQLRLLTRRLNVTRQYTTNNVLDTTVTQETTVKNLYSNDDGCTYNEDMTLYYNRRDVIQALHVEQSPLEWVPCAKELNFTKQHMTMRDVIQELIAYGSLKTIIFNGDVDLVCSSLGGEWFVRSLGVQVSS
ncbi:hypothetical protein MTO96_001347 [Rhipicephalus appendiculatus]